MSQKLLSSFLIGLLITGTALTHSLNGAGLCLDDEDDVVIVIQSNQGESLDSPRTPNTVRIEVFISAIPGATLAKAHSWVIDGGKYSSGAYLLHFNFGWSGDCNGYLVHHA